MNKYIVPYHDTRKGIVDVYIVMARSISECEDKLIDMNYSNSSTYQEFTREMRGKGIWLGKIRDLEEL